MEQKKEEGKAFFTQGKWADALASYQAALAYPAVPVDMKSLLLSNIAMCQLKLRDFAGTISTCDQAMALPQVMESVMEKLLFRRAQGYMETDQLTASAHDVKAVLQINPGNKPAALLLRQLQERARADTSGVGKALKSLRESPSLDPLRFLEHASDSSTYRDVVAQRGESVLWKCVYTCEDRLVGAAALRVLHKMTATCGNAVLAAVDVAILTTFVQPPQVALVTCADDFVLEVGVIGLCGALVGYFLAHPKENSPSLPTNTQRLLLDAVLNGLRSAHVQLQVAALDTLLTDLKDHAKVRTSLDELGIFPLLLSRADVLEEKTVSRVALLFSQVLASFEGKETHIERLVQDYCVLPIMRASSMAAASPGAVLLCSVFLVNAKLGSVAIQSQASFFKHLGALLLGSSNMLAHQELVMDLVAFVAGSDTGAACIPLDLRVELGKLMQCDMDDKHLKLQATAVAALVKLHIVEKTFEAETPTGHMMVDSVLDLLERLDNTGVRPSVVGSTAAERSIEALSYIITFTSVKDLLVKRPKALAPLLHISPTDTPSNMLYGIAYSLHHLLTSESHLKKQKMANSEMTPDQYEQLQHALKQKSELDDGDSPQQVHARLAIVLGLPTAVKTLVQLLKTKSSAVLELAIQSALHATESVEMRGKLVQGGLLAGLFPHAYKNEPAQQAIAKILITTNPNLIPSAQLLSAVQPLRALCQNKHDSALLQFEALMALTNIASVSMETKARILADQGLSAIQYLQFSDHHLVRRAATECLTNLLPHDDVLTVFCQPDKARLWLAFSSIEESEEDFETARAAAGALATVSQYGEVCKVLMEQEPLVTVQAVLGMPDVSPELVHRHVVVLQNLLEYVATLNDDKQALYKAQMKLMLPTVQLLVTSTPVEIKPVAQACLDLLLQF
ncbi:hypothetical protein H310_10610 [Aphanomyces invadans]|uniref:Protein unc-45 homolog B n=1 Tax=Aphanomyces invadans TaxID=157072 RepID=A0A024TQR7_9STRA|nr:hypothetical protein H310_10610 [Aphanomyces invadans]ETV95951.1 hypothetical protein H310_10610 [Aphanomyces invadans]|eukprot:XP_008875262.1 hypothetical protein H310_10610 [Aphanomyces invadans]